MQPWKGAPMWEAEVVEGRMEMLTVEQMWDKAVPVHPMVLFKNCYKIFFLETLAGQALLLNEFNFIGLMEAVRENGFGRIDVIHLAKPYPCWLPEELEGSEKPDPPTHFIYMTLVVIEHEGVCKAFRLFSLDQHFAIHSMMKNGYSMFSAMHYAELGFCFLDLV